MLRGVPISLLAVAILLAAGADAASLRGESAHDVIVAMRAGTPEMQRALSARPAWTSFTSRYGRWQAVWNAATNTPHRAFGPSFRLAGYADDATSVDRAVRTFISSQPELFGGAGVRLETVSATRHADVWYVRYRQLVRGIPITFSDWEFRVGRNGKLMMFGADAHDPATITSLTPTIPAAVAREAAHAGLAFDPTKDRVEGARDLCYVPVRRADGGTELRLAYPATVIVARPNKSQYTLVDARDGAVLWHDATSDDAITGNVTVQVHTTKPTDPLVTKKAWHQTMKAGGVTFATAVTDTFGNYSVTPPSSPTTVSASFTGPYCTVVRNDNTSASFSKNNVADPSVQNIAWTTSNSQDSERDAWYHANLAHDWVKGIDPSYTGNDYSLTMNVNINDGTDCDASWEPTTNSIDFYLAGSGCPNTATLPSVIWHEYGHSVAYNLYFGLGSANGVNNHALKEGMADAFAALLGDYPIIGEGFFGPPPATPYLRTAANTARWPQDASVSGHTTGIILSGAMWELRTSTSNALASRLLQFAKYGLPDDPDDGVAMNEFFVEALVADDNDADLSNGTPHSPQIIAAFNNHGIGTNFFMTATHTPIEDPGTTGPFPVAATITYGGPIGSFSSAKLFYSANGSNWFQVPMQPTGNPDEYGAQISKVSYGVARYYLQMTDSFGGVSTVPAGAPQLGTYQFIAGAASTVNFFNMESTPPGWTVGFTGDAAVSGVWERNTPMQTVAAPGSDHTVAGTMCYLTGLDTNPDVPGTNDVDGGKTTLVTNTFSATPGGVAYPVISYWRWYSDDAGDNPSEDPWRVLISNNNGSTWKLVENTTKSSNAWVRIAFLISDFVTPTSTMKMRFVAQDTLGPSLVEAALDDWQLVGYTNVADVPAATGPAELAVSSAWPNPFRGSTHIRYTLPARGRIDLGVFDLQGRKVRSLGAGEQAAGVQDADWDGLDDAGRRLATGPYYVRLSKDGQVVSRGVVLLR